MDRATRQRLVARCNPAEALGPDDERYVDIDRATQHGAGPRGRSAVGEIASQIEAMPIPDESFFLSGLPGSGKSTELRRLAARLRAPDGAALHPLIIDAEELIDLNVEVDLPDLLLVLLFGAERGVLALEGRQASETFHEGPVKRVLNWFTSTEVSVDSPEFKAEAKAGIPGIGEATAGAALALKIKNSPSLRARFRDRAASQLNGFLADINQELVLLDQRAQATGCAGLMLMVDSLEHLKGTSTTWNNVLTSAERVFIRLEQGLKLPVHTLFTVPPALVLRLKTANLEFIPMIKLWERGHRGRDELGFERARALIRRRVTDAELAEILGSADLEARRDRLIASCAGYPREMIRVLRKLCATTDPVAGFDQILSQSANNILDVVSTEEAARVAAQVALDNDVTVPEELQPVLDRLMTDNVILRYQNHERWYDVHPAVREKRSVKREIELLKAQRAANLNGG